MEPQAIVGNSCGSTSRASTSVTVRGGALRWGRLILLVATVIACRRRDRALPTEAAPTSPLLVAPVALLHGLAPPVEVMIDGVVARAHGRICGFAQVNGRVYPLDCISALLGDLAWASRAVVRRSLVSNDRELPAEVDGRRMGFQGPVRDQGRAGACTAFSLAATIDHEMRRSGSGGIAVSTMHLWSRYHTPLCERAITSNVHHPIARESDWPYESSTACHWTTGDSCECGGGDCGRPVDAERMAQANAAGAVELVDAEHITPDVDALRRVVASGKAVWFAMLVAQQFQSVRGPNAVVPDFVCSDSNAGHAMTIAGYRTQPDGTYFLLQNSWGSDWGDGGYAWIHEHTLFNNLGDRGFYVVHARPFHAPPAVDPTEQPLTPPEALPADRDASAPAAPAPAVPGEVAPIAQELERVLDILVPSAPHAPVACSPPLVADSVTRACSNACSDGSPPALGQCLNGAGCGPSQVGAAGRCFEAGATRSLAADPASGVTYQCGVGGCSYRVPYGRFRCASPAGCSYSCPMLRPVLAASTRGMNCVE